MYAIRTLEAIRNASRDGHVVCCISCAAVGISKAGLLFTHEFQRQQNTLLGRVSLFCKGANSNLQHYPWPVHIYVVIMKNLHSIISTQAYFFIKSLLHVFSLVSQIENNSNTSCKPCKLLFTNQIVPHGLFCYRLWLIPSIAFFQGRVGGSGLPSWNHYLYRILKNIPDEEWENFMLS